MDAEIFRQQLLQNMDEFKQTLATDNDEWVVKGFIDIYENIYTISIDTKVISKIIELMLFPIFVRFGQKYNYQLVLSGHQNHYPDITFIAEDGSKFALDIKSTYRLSQQVVSGFTLGAFTGYFRQRTIAKNITFPYQEFSAHFVFGVIYTRSLEAIDERKRYTLADLKSIHSVAHNFDFLLHEKWRIASDKPGSGNTKNIGSIKSINDLLVGNGTFAPHGEKIFDNYWMNYLTGDMARAIESIVPYRNLTEYWQWRNQLTSEE